MSPYPYKHQQASDPFAFNPDIVLRSSDHVDFCTFQPILARSSEVFARILILPASHWRDPITGLQPAAKREDGVPVVRMPEHSKVLRSLVSTVSPGPVLVPDTLPEILEVLTAANKYGIGIALDALRTLMPPIETLVNEHNAAATFKMALAGRLLDEALAAAHVLVRAPAWCARTAGLTDAEQCVFARFRGGCIRQLVVIAKQMRDYPEESHGLYFRPRNGMQACVSGLIPAEAQRKHGFGSVDVPCWWYSYWQGVVCDLESGQLASTAEALFMGLEAARRAHAFNEQCEYCSADFGKFRKVMINLTEGGMMKLQLNMDYSDPTEPHTSSPITRP